MADEAPGEQQAGLDILSRQPGIFGQHRLVRLARGQQAQQVLDGQPLAADDRLAAEDGGVHGDAGEQFAFGHGIVLQSRISIVTGFIRRFVINRDLSDSAFSTAAGWALGRRRNGELPASFYIPAPWASTMAVLGE